MSSQWVDRKMAEMGYTVVEMSCSGGTIGENGCEGIVKMKLVFKEQPPPLDPPSRSARLTCFLCRTNATGPAAASPPIYQCRSDYPGSQPDRPEA
jgi:hypothetical protein